MAYIYRHIKPNGEVFYIGKGGKLILNTETGIYYNTITEAAESRNMSKITLIGYLLGNRKNLTSFIKV